MIGLRALPYRWLLPVLLAVDTWAMYSRGPQWRGSWMWTVDWSAGDVIIYGPLAAGVAATAASWQRKVFAETAAAALDRPRWVLAGLGSALLWLLGVHAFVLGHALVLTAIRNPYTDWGALAAGPEQFVVLAGFVGAGWIAGQLLGATVAGVVAAAGSFIVQVEHWWLPDALFDWGGSTGDVMDQGYKGVAVLACVLMALGVLALAIATPAQGRRPGTARWVIGIAGVALAVGSISPAQAVGDTRLTAPRVEARCEPVGTVTLCLGSLEFARTDIRRVVDTAVRAARAVGVGNVADTVVQSGVDGRLPVGITAGPGQRRFTLDAAETNDQAAIARRLARALVYDRGTCDLIRLDPFELELAAAGWYYLQIVGSDTQPADDKRYWTDLTRQLTKTEIVRLLDAFGACDIRGLAQLKRTTPLE